MPTITERLNAIITAAEGARSDAAKCESGVEAAGTRVRKAMQGIATSAKEIRKDILATRKKKQS